MTLPLHGEEGASRHKVTSQEPAGVIGRLLSLGRKILRQTMTLRVKCGHMLMEWNRKPLSKSLTVIKYLLLAWPWPASGEMREDAQFNVRLTEVAFCKGGLLRLEQNGEHSASPYSWIELISLLGWQKLTFFLLQSAFPDYSGLTPDYNPDYT